MLRLVASCGVVQAGLACQTSTTPGCYAVAFFRFHVASRCICCIGGDWPARIAAGCGWNCQRTRGFPAEHLTASAESLYMRTGYSLSDIRVAREFLEIGGIGRALQLFSAG